MVELFNLVGSQTTNCANSIAAQPSKFGKGSQREDVNVFLQSNQSQKIDHSQCLVMLIFCSLIRSNYTFPVSCVIDF